MTTQPFENKETASCIYSNSTKTVHAVRLIDDISSHRRISISPYSCLVLKDEIFPNLCLLAEKLIIDNLVNLVAFLTPPPTRLQRVGSCQSFVTILSRGALHKFTRMSGKA